MNRWILEQLLCAEITGVRPPRRFGNNVSHLMLDLADLCKVDDVLRGA
jgi:hypothetical protein